MEGEKGKREEEQLKLEQGTVDCKIADAVLRQALATVGYGD